jgi:uncharacterized protein YkwD
MDSELFAYITDILRPNQPLYEYYRRSLVADESLIQTALAWRQPPQRSMPVSYCEWDATGDTTRTWGLDDLTRLQASGSPFARKIDPVQSGDLLEALDAMIDAAATKAPDQANSPADPI